jgi:hypothetical protein
VTIEEVIRSYLAQNQTRGATATPGHAYYERARNLLFRRCACSERAARAGDWTMAEHIARTPRGAYLYIGTNRRGLVSCGPKGYHSSQYRNGPPCV